MTAINMKTSTACSLLMFYFDVCVREVQSELGLSLEPTTLSSLNSLSVDTTSGEVNAAQFVPLPYPSSEPHNSDKPSFIQPSFTQSFNGQRNNKSLLNRSVNPSQTLYTTQNSYSTMGEDYDVLKLLGSSKTIHQKTSSIEITSSSPMSLTTQHQVSMSQQHDLSKTSTLNTDPLVSQWALYDTMLKTEGSFRIQSSAAMTITSSALSSALVSSTKFNVSCKLWSCPTPTDICTPLKGGKFHCSCKQVYGR
ncbi:uncharacterized protein LOC133174871 [Saccostrea echinata]|uniref:uncharacterized protein LOC133174871 n=1 Tax=Saccostrea echinata TaxID=191078 RepID=UPI002A8407BC|nr:uncharacterized protein LOC133174871 [Saccostrea echinata]